MAGNGQLVEVLKRELEFLEQGGYRAEAGKRWRPQFIFEDSPSCVNYDVDREHRVPCSECPLISLVPPEDRKRKFPCRYIPLTEKGETIDYFYRSGTREELETALSAWLKKTIQWLEREPEQEESCSCDTDRLSQPTFFHRRD